MRIWNEATITAGDMNAATITGVGQDFQHAGNICALASWTGTAPVGTLKLQGSADGVTWADVPSATLAISGNSGAGMIPVSNIGFLFVRAVYTKTSGTGTLSVVLTGKGF